METLKHETEKPILPNDIIVDNFAEMITSDEVHGLRGAAIGALYLSQQGEITTNKYNLAINAANVLALNKNKRAIDETESGRKPFKFRDNSRGTRIATAHALLALAVYKIENNHTESEDEVFMDFQRSIDASPKFYRPILKQNWIGIYYRGWLSKPEPTGTELIGIAAGRRMVRSKNPFRVIRNISESRISRKQVKRRKELEVNFEEFISHRKKSNQTSRS